MIIYFYKLTYTIINKLDIIYYYANKNYNQIMNYFIYLHIVLLNINITISSNITRKKKIQKSYLTIKLQ